MILRQVQVQAEQGHSGVQPAAGRVAGTQCSSSVSDVVSRVQCGAERLSRWLGNTLGSQQTLLRAVPTQHQSTGIQPF